MRRSGTRVLALGLLLPWLGACVSLAEFRKVEYEVNKLKQRHAVGGESRATLADLAAEVEALQEEVARLNGRLDVAEHQSGQALEEARAARQAAHGGAAAAEPAGSGAASEVPGDGAGLAPEEMAAYREAYAAWRADDTQACIDRFRTSCKLIRLRSTPMMPLTGWRTATSSRVTTGRPCCASTTSRAAIPTGNKAADASLSTRRGTASTGLPARLR